MKKTLLSALFVANLLSAQSITLLKDINTGANPSTPALFTEYGGRLYFYAASADSGTEIWSTDGTEAGTLLLVDKVPGTGSFLPSNMKVFNNKLYISNLLGNTDNPVGIYSYDGTSFSLISSTVKYPGTMLATDESLYMGVSSNLYKMGKDDVIANVTGDVTISNNMAPINGQLVVAGKPTASTTNYYQLYKYDNTSISLLKNIYPTGTANPQNFFYSSALNKVLFCAATQASGLELWSTDGTEVGSTMIKDINVTPATSGSFPGTFTQVGNKIFFTANNGTNGYELWVTDGTAEGTTMVKDIYAGTTSSNPYNLTELNGKLYFLAGDESKEAKLWESDGTEAGTKVALELRPGYTSFTIGKMAAFNGALYISAKLYVDKGQELYKIDVSNTTLSAENTSKSNITFYPNPTSGTLYFKNVENGNYQLFDMTGRLIQSDHITKNQPAQINAKPGVYQIRVTTADGRTDVNKVIIK
ncbi:ELWxxDGT repeat protein [Epilithonimonas sp. UC225_85]|uniref:ELWxxDGT repeat protein n=1 Tax=Epilithonimonas sp. UC225_85 TaxID=3350167 RepID=UPI0036D3257A